MKKTSGFTLIELMIVVAIIAIIAAIAIPNLLRSRIQSNETSAIGSVRAIAAAQTSYSASNGNYATSLTALADGSLTAYLVGSWPTKAGYTMATTGVAVNSVVACYDTTAAPTTYNKTGVRYFFSDCTGVIRENSAGAATSASPAIDALRAP